MGSTVEAKIGYRTEPVRVTLTRPTNTTQYSAGDVVANADDSHLVFLKAVRPERLSGIISNARITSNVSAGTKPDLELWLFHTDITEVGDNEAFAVTDAEQLNRIGIIKFPVAEWLVGGANACCEKENLGLVFKAASTSIYGVLVARNAYAPTSGEIFTVELVISQD